MCVAQEWGVKVADPEAAFKEVDADGGGQALFDQPSTLTLPSP